MSCFFVSKSGATQQKQTCKIMQDCTRILQESCIQDLLGTCTRYMSLFLHVSCTIPARSCTYLARNGARFCKSCCKNNYLHFLHIFLQELVQDCARIVQEKGHIACTCQASLECKILAQSCMILQVRFCWVCKIYQKQFLL